MKIRTDFVTNSSSSSFVTLRVESETLAKLFKKYENDFRELEGDFQVSENTVNVSVIESECSCPETKYEIIESICELFEELEEFTSDNLTDLVNKNKDKILNDLKGFEITFSTAGWEGDSDERFDMNNYSEVQLKNYYEIIAKEKGCSVDNVTSEDFYNFALSKTSLSEHSVTYDEKTKELIETNNFTLTD